jgi:hypothetical protein
MDIVFDVGLIMLLGGGAIMFVITFLRMGQQQQMKMISEWLLLAVVQAEKELGGGTGQIKLRYVYDMFLAKFKYFAMIISFEQFSSMVDVSLEKMKTMLNTNNSLQKYIKGE